MTENQIEEIKKVLYNIRNLNIKFNNYKDQYNKQVEDLKRLVKINQNICDHRLPDGSSADDGGFMFGSCTICGYFDL